MSEKILMFGLDERQTELVRKIASNLRIKTAPIDKTMYGCTLGMLAEGKGCPENLLKETQYGTLIVFCDVSDKHLDRILARLRSENAAIDYKAVLTPSNRGWNVRKLYFELERERNSLVNGI